MYWYVIDNLTNTVIDVADSRRDAYARRKLHLVNGRSCSVRKEQ
jgi:hypothetical protein